MIIVMFHVFGGHLAAILDLQRFYANGTYPVYSLCAGPTIRPKKYVSNLINNGVMAVFMFAPAILNILISPRVPGWHQPDYQ